jgi:hypothetical protein
MPRSHSSIEFKYAAPIKATRARFKLSAAFANIDANKISSKASVEIEVGTFEGDGCGRDVTAVVKKGEVVQLKVSPCAAVTPVTVDPSLKSLVIAARKKLGATGSSSKFRPMQFAAFQRNAHELTIKTITCIQICIWGHCIVCCTTPFGDLICGTSITIHR